MSEEVVGQVSMGRGVTYQERLILRIPFPECGLALTEGSVTAHQRQRHGEETEIDRNCLPVIQTEHLPHVFCVRFPKGISQF